MAGLGDHVDADRFETRIDFADKSKFFVPDTVQEIAAQGVKLVLIDDDNNVFVIGENLKKAKNITEDDRTKFHERTGRQMRTDFLSRLETKAGTVLSTVRADIVLKRMSGGGVRAASPTLHEQHGETSEDSERAASAAATAFAPN